MNALKAIKVAELRKKLSVIPAKILIAIVLVFLVIFKEMDFKGDIAAILEVIKADPVSQLIRLALIYGVVSYVYLFIELFHNWIIGVVASAGAAFLVVTQISKLGDQPLRIALIIMLFGGPLLDLFHLMRYSKLKADVIRAEEDRLDTTYDSGFDDGYQRGYVEGNRTAYGRIREQDDAEEEEWLESRKRRRARLREDWDDEEEFIEDSRRHAASKRRRKYIDDYDEGEEYRRLNDDDNYNRRYINGEDEGDYEDGTAGDNAGNPEAQNDTGDFFAGCNNEASVKRRYHDLCKVYHPDSGNGSAEIFYQVKSQYEAIMDSRDNTQ